MGPPGEGGRPSTERPQGLWVVRPPSTVTPGLTLLESLLFAQVCGKSIVQPLVMDVGVESDALFPFTGRSSENNAFLLERLDTQPPLHPTPLCLCVSAFCAD